VAQQPRQQQNRGDYQRRAPAQRTENQQISDAARQKAAFAELFQKVERLKAEITAVLRGVPFAEFRACLMIAVRTNPRLLECEQQSLVTAVMKAAWDDTPPDGRLAAIIPSHNRKRNVLEARYQAMVAGMRRQILKGGKVDDLQTEIVYANEVSTGCFKLVRGSTPSIHHEPIVIDDDRGKPVGAYSVAWLANGRVSVEYMTEAQILSVRDSSQSGDVWKSAYDKEMWRKTVLRRHRKALPGANDIRDSEAVDMFPQFAPAQEPISIPARPQRSDYEQLAYQPDMSINDFGGGLSEREMDDEEEAIRNLGQSPNGAPAARQERQAEPPRQEGLSEEQPMPQTPAEWEQWADRVKTTLLGKEIVADVNSFRREQARFIDACPAPLSEEVNDAFFERIADLSPSRSGGQ